MREVTVKVYKFSELKEEVRDALIEAVRSELDIGESVQEFLDESLLNMGLKGITVEDFSIGDPSTEDFVVLNGDLSESLSKFESNSEYGQHISKIKSAFLGKEDASEENPNGLLVFGRDGIDDDIIEDVTSYIDEEITKICDSLIEQASDHINEISSDEEIIESLKDSEFLEDGTYFQE